MTDVVEIAKERRVRLAAELGTLDDFISMAEYLVKFPSSKSNQASATIDQWAAESTGPATLRPYSAAASAHGEEAVCEDFFDREPKAGEWLH